MLNKKALLRILIITFVYIVAIVLHYAIDINQWIDLSIFIVLYLASSYDILLNAIKNIFRGQIFDENLLMTIATIGAFVIGEYVDAVAVMILFQIGELFQNYAVNKSRNSIANLMNICPQEAYVLKDNNIVPLSPDEVNIGDIIVVRAGEKVPLDGVVVDGESHIDMSALNGEWQLQAVKQGDAIMSGSINTESVLKIRTTTTYQDSTVMRILQLVEEASDNKAPAENFITKFSKYYTPIVVLSALLLAIIPSLFDQQWAVWAKRAMMFLFVSCPCALVISVPMTFFGGIGCASTHGILIKGSNYLEKLSHVNTIVMDKTGTLTQGKFAVKAVLPKENEQKILQCALIAESLSTHPIAQSIVAHCKEQSVDINQFNYIETKGQGIVAINKNDNSRILCGNSDLLKKYNISIDEIEDIAKNCTTVYVAKDQTYLGQILIADILKPDTKEAIANLDKMGIKTIMLTGDNQANAQEIAGDVGIDKYFAQLLPHQKVEKLETLMQDKKNTVAFVGDGINDAPSLMRADIGIAMGGIGSDSAIEASDIVLINDNLSAIPLAKKIANKTVSIAKQNIAFALTIKIAVLILSAIGLVNSMIIAILADVGVSIVAILNAMRTLTYKRNNRRKLQQS